VNQRSIISLGRSTATNSCASSAAAFPSASSTRLRLVGWDPPMVGADSIGLPRVFFYASVSYITFGSSRLY
jgi:hypothetical protein